MHGGQREAALQRRIGLRMPERHPRRPGRVGMRLDALDAAAQNRKRVGASAAHASSPGMMVPLALLDEPGTGPIVHGMF